ncbi:tRNA (adenosine(37)-N6)-dimethylallyltransferase MiaA [Salipaludibacillus neizhouensis]|uniref:tRNA dimethylallyltransferase n=1 Tax=Salipaludibacillus neizhouensis TaxID=885475 RepID=A0A3A9KEC5_9BACI|nr:tRNA (adenosine(37)-N6)-dimethylallyltransferase MiaA [Salipaludibacillus neizhouensis]RKL69080.1 tRNA (adenosine(37)-N6)-dimethylallyltransferase MiaA [Salipaludibacillus neizhouensis]
MTTRKPLIVVVGPTAVGKTATSIQLAQHFNGEIISGDSMQVYRDMDIGTAKITPEEMEDVPHHLIDIINPQDSFSVADFQSAANTAIHKIYEKGRIPFIVGGTGLYVNAVLYNYDFSEKGEDTAFRERLEQYAEENGNEALHSQLKDIDPESYQELHPNNRRRVIRTLEVYHLTGKPLRSDKEENRSSSYDFYVIGLTMDRDKLYERINLRVEQMIQDGLIEEVKKLTNEGFASVQSMQAIGYKEITPYILGDCSKEEAIDNLKQNSRRFAKRQLTWFRNKMDIEWFDMTDDREEKIEEIILYLEGKLF